MRLEPSFYAAAVALARKIATTSTRLAGQGVRCVACFALAERPEVIAMRTSFSRTTSGTAPTEPSVPAWHGSLPTSPAVRRTNGLAPSSPALRATNSTPPTEPSVPVFRGPIGGKR